jgi:hypothetical protein
MLFATRQSTPAPSAYSGSVSTSSQPVQDTYFRQSILFAFHPAALYVGHPSNGGAGAGSCVCETGKEQGTKLVGMFEVILTRRKRFGWRWRVCDHAGKIFADGFERSRPSAKYHGERALFFLLSQAHLRNRSAAPSED